MKINMSNNFKIYLITVSTLIASIFLLYIISIFCYWVDNKVILLNLYSLDFWVFFKYITYSFMLLGVFFGFVLVIVLVED